MAKAGSKWTDNFGISQTETHADQALFQKYPGVFRGTTSTIKNFKAGLRLKGDSKPVFRKARPVPCALQQDVGLKLDRLEKAGIMKKVKNNDWISPIVMVPKHDRNICTCRYYTGALNPFLQDNSYVLMSSEGQFATLAGRDVVSKTDLSLAHRQLELLTDNSKELCMSNTQQGLYQYQILLFDVMSAPGKYSRLKAIKDRAKVLSMS